MTFESQEVAGSVEAQLVSLYAERELLERELGVSETTAIVDMVRSLEGQLRDFYSQREHGAAASAPATDHRSMELQLVDLYAQRERLANSIGCCDADEVRDMVHSLEGQLRDLYREKENGELEVARVAAQIKQVAAQVGTQRGASEISFVTGMDGGSWKVRWRAD